MRTGGELLRTLFVAQVMTSGTDSPIFTISAQNGEGLEPFFKFMSGGLDNNHQNNWIMLDLHTSQQITVRANCLDKKQLNGNRKSGEEECYYWKYSK